MARLIDRSFNPNVPVYVRRFFVAAGRHWNPGDLFDWTRLAIAQRRVKQLFDNNKLMHLDDAPAPKPDLAGLQAREAMRHVEPAPEPEPEPTFAEDLTQSLTEAVEMEAASEPVDELDELDMKALRAIAAEEGAPSRVSREAQRQAIRENRLERAAG